MTRAKPGEHFMEAAIIVKGLVVEVKLTVFDLETTGVNPWEDRIVEISLFDSENSFCSRVNPGVPIPPDATKIHGIADEDVKIAPRFHEFAAQIWPYFQDRILMGYNSRKFDTIMLHREFIRAMGKAPFSLETVREIDVYQVWRSVETQNLASAARRWLHQDDYKGHNAYDDTMTTFGVLQAIQDRYRLSLDDCVSRSMTTTRSPSFDIKNGEICFTFGMHRGKPAKGFPEYLE